MSRVATSSRLAAGGRIAAGGRGPAPGRLPTFPRLIASAVGASGTVAAAGISGGLITSYNANTTRTQLIPPALTGALDLTQAGRGANYIFTDPTFSKRIVRITEKNTNPDPAYVDRWYMTSGSAEQHIWNKDSTKFWILDAGGAVIPFNFNPSTFQASRVGSPSNGLGGLWLFGTVGLGPCWSYENANYLYGAQGFEIRRVDFTGVTGTSTSIPHTVVTNVNTIYNVELNPGQNLSGACGDVMVSSANPDESLMVPFGGGGVQDTWTFCLHYNLATGAYKVLDTRYNTSPGTKMRVYDSATDAWTNTTTDGHTGIHNARIDRTGRYIHLSLAVTPPGGSNVSIWDTQAGTVNNVTVANKGGGHKSSGWGYYVNDWYGDDAYDWQLRPLSNLASVTALAEPKLSDPTSNPQHELQYQADEHTSWHNAANGTLLPVFSSPYRMMGPVSPYDSVNFNGAWRPWDNEIIAIATDGSNTVWRFCHTRSQTYTANGYTPIFEDFVFGNISQDGRFCLFTSNWERTLGNDQGGNLRRDVFCVECA